ncbi:MAG: hypothetical protein ABFD00_10705 [Chloroherpetonaceae bacterium]|nr:hypothetical protein [bacterium]
MKKLFLIVLLSILALPSCRNTVEPISDCPLWYPIYGPDIIPIEPAPKGNPIIHGVSRDGNKLAFNGPLGFQILDLKTGYMQTFSSEYFNNKLPPNVIFYGGEVAYWCPYDNNRLLLKIATFTDTIGDGKRYEYGQNLYIMSIDGKEFKKITPVSFGPLGEDCCIISWLEGSSMNEDLILFCGRDIYIPQKDQWIPKPIDGHIYSVSPDNKYYFYSVDIGDFKEKPVLNGVDLKFADNIGQITHESWSHDSKKLILSVYVNEPNVAPEKKRYSEIWIIDVEKVLRERPAITPVSIINIRQRFCMYSYDMGAEFITGSTLAVSMWRPEEDCGFIYEISTKGDMIRQLTFTP